MTDWPAVRRATGSPDGICEYLGEFDNGTPVDALRTPPSARGRIFRESDFKRFPRFREALDLAPEQRRAWRAIFDYYVFSSTQDPGAHIPEARRGVLGKLSPDLARQVRAFLAEKLKA